MSEKVFSTGLTDLIDFTKPSLWISVGAIALNPIFWNVAARSEYRNKTISRWFRKENALHGCAALALAIIGLNSVRSVLFKHAMDDQPEWSVIANVPLRVELSYLLFGTGLFLGAASHWALGWKGTYLADYFGFRMSEMVVSFPFNVFSSPMYIGSTIAYASTALYYNSPAGFFLTAVVWLCYHVALRFEDPFTAMIYSTAAQAEDKKKE